MYDPERYEANKSAASRDADEFVPLLVKGMPWKNKEVILDYGCGAGSTGWKFLLPQAEAFDSVIKSVDISPQMLQHAKKLYPHDRISYAVGNILDQDFPFDQQFDKIFAVYVFHFVKNYDTALQKFFHLLKPGGYMGFTVLAKSTSFKSLESIATMPKWMPYMKEYQKFVPKWVEQDVPAEEAFRSHLHECGFNIVQLSTHQQSFFFEEFDTLLNLFVSLNPFSKTVPNDMINDLKEEYRSRLINHWNIDSNSESIETTYDLLFAIVQKPAESNN